MENEYDRALNTVNIRPLHPELAEVAVNQLNEVPDRVPEEIRSLREWLEQQPHLTTRTDDQYLVAFLRFCKFDQECTRKRIEYYYTYRTENKDLLKSNSIDDNLLMMCRSGIMATLPKPRGHGGPCISFTRMGKINPSIHTVQDVFRYMMFRAELFINTDDNWVISGVLEIIDFNKIPYSFLRQFEVNLFRRMNNFLEHGVPSNLVGTHIVGASKEAQLILSLVRHCMTQKHLLHIHSNLESLQKAIGVEYLPEEYGGTNGTLDGAVASFEEKLMSFSDYFDENDNYGVNEDARLGGKKANEKTMSSLETATSTLRNLDLD